MLRLSQAMNRLQINVGISDPKDRFNIRIVYLPDLVKTGFEIAKHDFWGANLQ
jgi:hypothetical protein